MVALHLVLTTCPCLLAHATRLAVGGRGDHRLPVECPAARLGHSCTTNATGGGTRHPPHATAHPARQRAAGGFVRHAAAHHGQARAAAARGPRVWPCRCHPATPPAVVVCGWWRAAAPTRHARWRWAQQRHQQRQRHRLCSGRRWWGWWQAWWWQRRDDEWRCPYRRRCCRQVVGWHAGGGTAPGAPPPVHTAGGVLDAAGTAHGGRSGTAGGRREWGGAGQRRPRAACAVPGGRDAGVEGAACRR